MDFFDRMMAEARQRAREKGDTEEMASGVMRAEAKAAAWHAVVIQGGFSTPEIEADRLSRDRGGIAPVDKEV